ncbi:MAG TPA: tyrosine-protein phosphatase [Urbifossiella sp.]|jgi:tyrosine-protein phosphatase SIW14|nr:tyrosine-protein phosphatase [Urbifossiella sp.]
MRKPWQGFLVVGLAALLIAGPLAYSMSRQYHRRNFRVVEDGVLYRSGQLSPDGLAGVMQDYRIKTLVTLRTTRKPELGYPDAWEADVCKAHDIKHIRITPKVWGPDEDGEIPAEENVRRFLDVVNDPANHPVLVHCMAGIHRTGTLVAVFRMERQHWPVDRAIDEMEFCGFKPEVMHEHIRHYLTTFRPSWQAGGAH